MFGARKEKAKQLNAQQLSEAITYCQPKDEKSCQDVKTKFEKVLKEQSIDAVIGAYKAVCDVCQKFNYQWDSSIRNLERSLLELIEGRLQADIKTSLQALSHEIQLDSVEEKNLNQKCNVVQNQISQLEQIMKIINTTFQRPPEEQQKALKTLNGLLTGINTHVSKLLTSLKAQTQETGYAPPQALIKLADTFKTVAGQPADEPRPMTPGRVRR